MKRFLSTLILLLAFEGAASAQTSFRFIAWGDSRGNSSGVNTSVLSTISNQVNSLSPRPAFTIFDGDLCYTYDSTCTSTGSSGWKYALNNGSPGNGMYNITFGIEGNHDDNASSWNTFWNGHAQTTVTASGATNFSYYPVDGANRTYSFDYSNSHFSLIDNQGGDISTLVAGQIGWLDSDITAAEARGATHTFIITHGPMWSVNEHYDYAQPNLVAVMNKHASISAAFNGHEHVLAYAHVDSSRISGVTRPWEEFVGGGAGAPSYSCTSGASEYCSSSFGFMTVDVNGPTFTVNLYFQGQAVSAETWSFTKSTTPPISSVSISPNPLVFTSQAVGTTSAVLTSTLTNTGSVALTTTQAFTINGDFAFGGVGTCPGIGGKLAPGGSCTLSAKFTPTASGARTGSMKIYDDAANSPQTLNLSGVVTTTSPAIRLSATSLTFVTVQTTILTNTGNVPLAITSIAITGANSADFSQKNNCPSSLAAAASCSINVSTNPTAIGSRTAAITITDNASGSPQIIALSAVTQ